MRELVNIDVMQLDFIPRRGITDVLLIVRRMQKKYINKKKNLYMCCVDIEKAFVRVPRKVMEWEMRKKGSLELIVWAVIWASLVCFCLSLLGL